MLPLARGSLPGCHGQGVAQTVECFCFCFFNSFLADPMTSELLLTFKCVIFFN